MGAIRNKEKNHGIEESDKKAQEGQGSEESQESRDDGRIRDNVLNERPGRAARRLPC
jgi:hypothetical protein